MKLLVAFVQEGDADRVGEALRREGHRFTRITSTGGFLQTPNVTLVMAVNEEVLPEVVNLYRANCSIRDVEVPLVLSGSLREWQERVVNYAGATILVVDLEDLIRL
ncbi:MAG: cyclic-di-AMP receptor [Chloroflexi bacterium]|nr:cyclic-di-AMP receptor [Chloroflexota bacterium]